MRIEGEKGKIVYFLLMFTSGGKHTGTYRGNHMHLIDKNHINTYMDTSNNYTPQKARAHIHTGAYNCTHTDMCHHMQSHKQTHTFIHIFM